MISMEDSHQGSQEFSSSKLPLLFFQKLDKKKLEPSSMIRGMHQGRKNY
jgi:hypothetical protein